MRDKREAGKGLPVQKRWEENTQAPTGVVLNIQHFCTNDGPGIWSTVFLKSVVMALFALAWGGWRSHALQRAAPMYLQ